MKFILTSLAILFFSLASLFAQEAPIISGELIVQLNKTITAKDLTIQLAEYNGVKSGVALDRVLSKSASIYLFKYDVNRVPEGKVLDFIYANAGVSIAGTIGSFFGALLLANPVGAIVAGIAVGVGTLTAGII